MSTYTSKVAREARQFSGSGTWYKHALGIVFTDGIHWLREQLDCYWLIDDIAILSRKFWKDESFITADFKQNDDSILKLTDGNNRLLHQFQYCFTDLEIDKLALSQADFDPFLRLFLVYDGGFEKHVLLLPSEY